MEVEDAQSAWHDAEEADMTMLSWPAWGTTAGLSVTDPSALHAAQRLIRDVLVRMEKAADLRNPRAEIHAVVRAAGRQVRVGRPLAAMIGTALDAARSSAGLVDPTVGNAVLLAESGAADGRALGGRRSWLPVCTEAVPPMPRPAIGWQSVDVEGRHVTAPPGVLLDLTAVGKAITVQHCAELVSRRLGVGALFGLGGDVATAGPAPAHGWQIPGLLGSLGSGDSQACVTRQVIDPRSGRIGPRVWASVSVRCGSAEGGVVAAKTLALAAAVIGPAAPLWLDDYGIPRSARQLVPATPTRLPPTAPTRLRAAG